MKHWMIAAWALRTQVSSLSVSYDHPSITKVGRTSERAEVSIGDGVALFRVHSGAGVVGFGEITKVDAVSGPLNRRPFEVRFNRLFIGSPVPLDEAELLSLGGKSLRLDRGLPVEIANSEWEILISAADRELSAPWPAAWELEPGSTVRRAEFNTHFGGPKAGKISPSARTPNVFIFLDAGRGFEGLEDRWTEGKLQLIGRPEDRSRASSNKAIVEHISAGRALRVFKQRANGLCTYIGEFSIDQDDPILKRVAIGTKRYTSLETIVNPRAPAFESVDVEVPIFQLRPNNNTAVRPEHIEMNPRSDNAVLDLRLLIGNNPINATTENDAISSGLEIDDGHSEFIRAFALEAQSHPELAQMEGASVLADILQYHSRKLELARLEEVVNNPGSRESELQVLLESNAWIFGGQFAKEPARRGLTIKDQIDLPLIRNDGSFHGVEIKQANVPKLVGTHRSHFIVGTAVHRAVSQAMNYLRSLDEQRDHILVDLGIDCRRASMTVVIGHPQYVDPVRSEHDIAAALRTYNSYLSRIEVITYKDLIDRAGASLQRQNAADE